MEHMFIQLGKHRLEHRGTKGGSVLLESRYEGRRPELLEIRRGEETVFRTDDGKRVTLRLKPGSKAPKVEARIE